MPLGNEEWQGRASSATCHHQATNLFCQSLQPAVTLLLRGPPWWVRPSHPAFRAWQLLSQAGHWFLSLTYRSSEYLHLPASPNRA